jgi:hypothetical protein
MNDVTNSHDTSNMVRYIAVCMLHGVTSVCYLFMIMNVYLRWLYRSVTWLVKMIRYITEGTIHCYEALYNHLLGTTGKSP